MKVWSGFRGLIYVKGLVEQATSRFHVIRKNIEEGDRRTACDSKSNSSQIEVAICVN